MALRLKRVRDPLLTENSLNSAVDKVGRELVLLPGHTTKPVSRY